MGATVNKMSSPRSGGSKSGSPNSTGRLKNELDAAKKAMQILQQENDHWQEKFRKVSAVLEKEREDLRAVLNNAKAKIKQLQTDLTDKTDKLREVEEEHAICPGKLAAANAEIDRLKALLAESRAFLESMHNQPAAAPAPVHHPAPAPAPVPEPTAPPARVTEAIPYSESGHMAGDLSDYHVTAGLDQFSQVMGMTPRSASRAKKSETIQVGVEDMLRAGFENETIKWDSAASHDEALSPTSREIHQTLSAAKDVLTNESQWKSAGDGPQSTEYHRWCAAGGQALSPSSQQVANLESQLIAGSFKSASSSPVPTQVFHPQAPSGPSRTVTIGSAQTLQNYEQVTGSTPRSAARQAYSSALGRNVQ